MSDITHYEEKLREEAKENNAMKTNKATAHTPGPWYVYQLAFDEKTYGDKEGWFIVVDNNDNEIAGPFESEEVARLIAAAPELLETLKAIVARIDGEFDHSALIAKGPLTDDSDADIKEWIEAAIARAEGSISKAEQGRE